MVHHGRETGTYVAAEGRQVMWTYQVRVERVIDGDTVRFLFDNGMYIRSSQSIRFAGVNAPELSEPGGREARDFVTRWLVEHAQLGGEWPFHITTEKDRQTFNRYIGVITCVECGENLNDATKAYLTG